MNSEVIVLKILRLWKQESSEIPEVGTVIQNLSILEKMEFEHSLASKIHNQSWSTTTTRGNLVTSSLHRGSV